MHIPTFGRWRSFASTRYRPFQAIAIGQAFTGSYASDALFVPLLLRLGAPPALVILVGSVPVGASVLQALAPQMLRRMRGNLSRLTVILTIAEMRGFVHAGIVAAIAACAVDASLGIVLISATVAIGQTAGMLSASNIGLWTAVVLPEQERRLVGPRMGAMTMALSTLLLLPAGTVLDAGLRTIGLWSYVGFFLASGIVSILTPLAVARLPYPGRVLVKSGDAVTEPLPEPFMRFTAASAIASVGQGLIPYLSLYAIAVLGASAGFAVILSGFGAAGALAGSLAAGSFLLGGSSSRVLRTSFVARAAAAVVCALAIPGNPAALPMLLVGAVLFSGGGNAGALASNERLYRLAPPDLRVRCQSRYVAATSVTFAVGAVACAGALVLSETVGWPVYTALFLGSGISRAIAGLRIDVSASWRSPTSPPPEAP
ncbi:MAG: hypothetical protein ACXWN4_04615 [Candidatus Limnocylindrales bacterium]